MNTKRKNRNSLLFKFLAIAFVVVALIGLTLPFRVGLRTKMMGVELEEPEMWMSGFKSWINGAMSSLMWSVDYQDLPWGIAQYFLIATLMAIILLLIVSVVRFFVKNEVFDKINVYLCWQGVVLAVVLFLLFVLGCYFNSFSNQNLTYYYLPGVGFELFCFGSLFAFICGICSVNKQKQDILENNHQKDKENN